MLLNIEVHYHHHKVPGLLVNGKIFFKQTIVKCVQVNGDGNPLNGQV